LSACDGVILLVDATQGLEAQTIAHFNVARDLGLKIIPVINKIDLPSADTDAVKKDLSELLEIDSSEILNVSAKSGVGVDELIEKIIINIPEPKGLINGDLKAFIIDSWFDNYLGIVVLVKIIDGQISLKDKIKVFSNKREFIVDKLGTFNPTMTNSSILKSGQVGFMIASIKTLDSAPVGDTIILAKNDNATALAGFKKIQPRVYSGFYPVDSNDYQESKKALDKLSLNDNSFTYEPESSQSLGHGFRCGFLGLLHMEIIRERVQREYNLEFLMTVPSVTYRVENKKGEINDIRKPSDLPDDNSIKCYYEPIALISIVTPSQHLGSVIELCTSKRGIQKDLIYRSNMAEIKYEIPLSEIIYDFFDTLKSASKGYASYDYDIIDYRESKMIRLDIHVNKKKIDALSQILHKDNSYRRSRELIENLKKLIPRQSFEITIQGCVGAKILSSTSIKGYRKDVTAKLYGGDVTRKMKLLKKQKEGKKKMKKIGNVEIPREAFYKFLSTSEE
jgi:GTP-binding protein LepA